MAHGDDVQEVANYYAALSRGLDLLNTMPICNRLILHVHEILLSGVRGQDRRPGEFRDLQNLISAGGIEVVRFVPPPVHEMREAMNALERYIGDRTATSPPLVQAALIHYQFEAIHPFMDGNGRLGRLLIPLFLHERQVMSQPLLYLSAFIERHRDEYKDHLLAVSQTGAWDAWIQFFLLGVRDQAEAAVKMANRLLALQREYRERLAGPRVPASLLQLVDALFDRPVITARNVTDRFGGSAKTAYNYIERLVDRSILTELQPQRYPRVFVADAIIQATMPDERGPSTARTEGATRSRQA